jgi:hypothetical protein
VYVAVPPEVAAGSAAEMVAKDFLDMIVAFIVGNQFTFCSCQTPLRTVVAAYQRLHKYARFIKREHRNNRYGLLPYVQKARAEYFPPVFGNRQSQSAGARKPSIELQGIFFCKRHRNASCLFFKIQIQKRCLG